jgi:DNA-binding CsgD family transcriptional regulator
MARFLTDMKEKAMEQPTKPNETLNPWDVLDTIQAHVAVLDHTGLIVHTNKAWNDFAANNRPRSKLSRSNIGVGSSYLEVCKTSLGPAAENALVAFDCIKAVLSGKLREFTLEYPCHSPTRQRWFSMRVTPLRGTKPKMVVTVHTNITELKMAEVQVQQRTTDLAATLEYLQEMVGKIKSSISLGTLLHPDAAPPLPGKKSKAMTSVLMNDKSRLKSLSDREMEVLLAIVRGERNADIASRLNLSTKSVSTYRSRVLVKANAKSNAELVAIVTRLGLINR